MSDKRTTPEPAAGARRRKRAAPTIDLTATEVPPAATAAEAPQAAADPPYSDPPPPPPEPPPAAMDTSAGSPWTWLSANIKGPALAAGIAGAALVTLMLFALWLTGLVPIRYAGVTAMRARVTGLEMQVQDLKNRPAGTADTKSLDAINSRLSQIEQTISKIPPNDPSVAQRLAAADNAMKSLGIALAALNRRSDDIAANAAQARERAELAQKAVAELGASVQAFAADAAKYAATRVSPGELDALQKRIAALEQAAKTVHDAIAKSAVAPDVPARLALSAAGLRDAAQSGASFAGELVQVKSLGADDKALAPLAPFAAGGLPTPTALAHELQALLPAMLKISGAQAPAGGFLERLQANAGRLVRIRPLDAPPGDDTAALLARLEIAAAHADIAAALADLGKLPAAARAPAASWIAKAQARQAALAAVQALAAETARALGPPFGPKAGAQ